MDRHELADRYARVKAAIPAHVKLIAVSKTRTVEEIRALYDLGQRAFGENYPQELRDKQPQLPADIEWHFIGHLQANKVKYIAPFVHLVHAVDSARLLDELQKRAVANERTIDVLLQLHIAREETKHGLDAPELRTILKAWDPVRWANIQLRGLMGMATFTSDRDQVAREFQEVARLYHALRAEGAVDKALFTLLSMGMSDDMDLAIAAGSNLVRVGSALFGPRS
jgi:pyridoxal phosphate enzyme (YggS family)